MLGHEHDVQREHLAAPFGTHQVLPLSFSPLPRVFGLSSAPQLIF